MTIVFHRWMAAGRTSYVTFIGFTFVGLAVVRNETLNGRGINRDD